jgi:hypothetical protein
MKSKMNWIKFSEEKPARNPHQLILGFYCDNGEVRVLFRSEEGNGVACFRVDECGSYYNAPDYWIYIKDIERPDEC